MIVFSKNKYLRLYNIFLSLFTTLGVFINHIGPLAQWTPAQFILFTAGVFLSFFVLQFLVFPILQRFLQLFTGPKSYPKRSPRTYALAAFACCILSYAIVWLAYYPGLWNYDAWQVNQVINHEYTTWHPLLHTLLIGNLYKLGLTVGTPSLGVILYDWIQILSMSILFAYISYLILTTTNNRFAYYAAVFFYALFPFHSLMAISSTKDVLFSVFVLLFLLQLHKVIGKEPLYVKDSILLFITGLLMLLFRNNAPHAYALFLILIIVSVLLKEVRLRNVSVLLIILIAYVLINNALISGLHAEKSSIAEAASIPAVQMGRIHSEGIANAKDEEIINRYIDWNRAHYDEHLADGLKENLKSINTTTDLLEMYLDSINLSIKHPLVSIDSFLYLHEGAWYIGDKSHTRIYGEGLTNRQGYFPTEIKDGFGFQLNSKLPVLEHIIEVLFSGNAYQKITVLPILLSPAFYNWICIFCICIMFSKKKKRDCLAASFLICLIFTTLLGPTVLVRYYYPIIVSCPLLLLWSSNSGTTIAG